MLANELNECRSIRFPIGRKALKVFEDSINAGGPEESYGILGVLVEVCVEDALIGVPRYAVPMSLTPHKHSRAPEVQTTGDTTPVQQIVYAESLTTSGGSSA